MSCYNVEILRMYILNPMQYINNFSQKKKKTDTVSIAVTSSTLFHMKITVSVTKSLDQDLGPCYLHLTIFSYLYTSSSASK